MTLPNVLFVTLDQFRGDALSSAGHPVVHTPVLDALASAGTRFARHYAQSAPCSPGRAALYTGTYQMNNRVVANGTPLDDRFDNVARVARRAGYDPVLFGYTDQSVDPRTVERADDPRLWTYEEVLPGFSVGLHLPGRARPWLEWLERLGYEVGDAHHMLRTEGERPAEHSQTAYLTDRVVEWLERADGPFFAHVSYLRPHPPYQAPGEYSKRYRPEDCPDSLPVSERPDGLYRALLAHPVLGAPADRHELARLKAQYFGTIDHVDSEVGRLLEAIARIGAAADTVVVVTADHADQLGDQGLIEKGGYFESSYHIPLIVSDGRRNMPGRVVEQFTEAVDVLPTICDAIGAPVPSQCDGYPLTPWLDGEEPPQWRTAAHYEWDWRDTLIGAADHPWPWDRRLEQQSLVVQRSEGLAYVQYATGRALAFDLAADPSWCTLVDDPAVLLGEAQQLLAWRAQHTERTMTGMLLRDGGIGRWPPAAGGGALAISERPGDKELSRS